MSMTKSDYELIASVLNNLYLGHNDWQRSLDQVANKFADSLQADNPKFNKNKFIKACGIGE